MGKYVLRLLNVKIFIAVVMFYKKIFRSYQCLQKSPPLYTKYLQKQCKDIAQHFYIVYLRMPIKEISRAVKCYIPAKFPTQ